MIQDKSVCEKLMDEANKYVQGSSKLTSQSVETSQAAGDSEWVPTLPRLPFGLSISPREFCVLENAYYDIASQQNKTIEHRKWKTFGVIHSIPVESGWDKLIRNESHNNEIDSFGDLYIYFNNPWIFV